MSKNILHTRYSAYLHQTWVHLQAVTKAMSRMCSILQKATTSFPMGSWTWISSRPIILLLLLTSFRRLYILNTLTQLVRAHTHISVKYEGKRKSFSSCPICFLCALQWDESSRNLFCLCAGRITTARAPRHFLLSFLQAATRTRPTGSSPRWIKVDRVEFFESL